MKAPVEEAFKYMDLAIEEDEIKARREAEKFFMDFISNMYAQAPSDGEKAEFTNARKRFMETIKPKQRQVSGPKKQKRFEWNIPEEALEAPAPETGVEKGG